MRKLLALLVLVPFAAVVVLSCDDHPTAPEEAQAATTVQESSTPLAAKVPTLPPPTRLAGAVVVFESELVSYDNSAFVVALCPAGKGPVSGGYSSGGDGPGIEFFGSGPLYNNSGQLGWFSQAYNSEVGSTVRVYAWALCVEMEAEVID